MQVKNSHVPDEVIPDSGDDGGDEDGMFFCVRRN